MDRKLVERLIADLQRLQSELPSDSLDEAPLSGDSQPVRMLRRDVDRAQWLAGILAHSPDVISVLELDGTLLYLSRAAPGLDTARFVGRNAADFVPDSHKEKWKTAVLRAASGHGPQQLEVFSAGNLYWETRIVPIEQRGKPKWLLSIGTDITAQRGAEAALELRNKQLEMALEASAMGQWSWEVENDLVTWDNASKRIFAWPEDRDDITYDDFMQRVHPGDQARVQEEIDTALKTGVYRDLQCRLVLPDASIRWIFCKGRVVANADGTPQSVIGGVMDVTHGKRTDEQHQRSAKLEAIGQLAGGVAHDFNNLLVAMLGSVDLAARAPSEADRRRHLDDCREAANRAAELTRQLLLFSRRQPLSQQTVELHEMLGDTLRLLQRLLPETIDIHMVRAPQLPVVFGDRGQLEQVVVNLCVNARDAMPTGGKLTLKTETVDVDSEYRASHPWAREGRYVLLSVADTGTGIAPDHIDRIYEPFFTTKDHGTGLGLATAYGVVQRHGGLLHVQSRIGEGTTFRIFLPIAEGTLPDAASRQQDPTRGGTETIILAEDEPAVQAVVRRILERAGYTVMCANDGVVAVECFHAHREQVAGLVLDAVMPRLGGVEALSEIRAIDPTLPAVLCSGYSEAQGHWSKRADGVEFLAKPYEPDTLLRVLRDVLDARTRN